ncbi:heterokaryon incompatibility protein-domain-containing protein [Xylariales sp. PMI_506]|nr:heterokaryon incompatibility protein-domain-containing protein [Xylariales sp. PMI_506]
MDVSSPLVSTNLGRSDASQSLSSFRGPCCHMEDCGDEAMAASHSPSAYLPLDFKNRQIRIARLLPSLFYTAPIRCVLSTACLDGEPQYEALSYAWGDPEEREPIYINGLELDVTTNLVAALRRLRNRTRPRNIWVDAICINQHDMREKSHQVNLMTEIYSRTTMAIIWLGEYSKKPPDPHHLRQRSSQKQTERIQPEKIDPNASLSRRQVQLATDAITRWASKQTFKNDYAQEGEALLALECFMGLPWWNRIWTVQEAILPKQALVKYGAHEMLLQQVFDAYSYAANFSFWETVGINPDHFWNKMRAITWLSRMGKLDTKSFAIALNVFRYRKASDPRDYIFALLGLGGPVVANYSLSTREVFMHSIRILIKESNSLFPLLRAVEICRSPELPTWAADWQAEIREEYERTELDWIIRYEYYNAALDTDVEVRQTQSDSILELRGMKFDQIVASGDYFDKQDHRMVQVVSRWRDLVKQECVDMDQYYPYGEASYSEAFQKVMETHVEAEHSVSDQFGATDAALGGVRKPFGPMATTNLRFFITQTGLIGVGTRELRPKDEIYVLLGGRMPFILRPTKLHDNGNEYHEYIGQAFVFGIMYGAVVEEGRQTEWVSLV